MLHLLAIAKEMGIPLSIDDFDAISARTPYICSLTPAGKYVASDYQAAGGSRLLAKRMIGAGFADGFFENDRITPTGLAGYLRERGLTRGFFAGLAYDFCVGYSALDARRLGFPAVVLRDTCRAIDLEGSAAAMETEFAKAGVAVIDSSELSG